MNAKTILLGSALIGAIPMAAMPAHSDDWGGFTANIALTTDYRFRGQSQSQGEFALSGGVDYAHESGFFAGVWASNVDFNDAAETYYEVDLYAGFTKAITGRPAARSRRSTTPIRARTMRRGRTRTTTSN